MKRITLIGSLTYGGAERQMVVLAQLLSSEGYDVFFVALGNNSFYSSELEKAQIKSISIQAGKLISKLKLTILFDIFKLYRIVSKEKIEVGISFLGECNFINCIVSMLRPNKYKAITGLRNARESLMLSKRELFYAKFERFALAKVCNSINALAMYNKNFPNYSEKLKVIYNIVELPQPNNTYTIRKSGKTHMPNLI